jgi:inositol 1,4,5-triphosphate receptor type 3
LDQTQLTREKYILDFLHILTKDEVYPLIWIFVFGFLGILKREWNYFYALQSFAIFFVNPTMKVVLSSIMLRYKQFISAIFGIFLTILFFSSLTFYFFRSEFGDVSDDNICNSYFQCFVSISNFGLRAGSIGLPLHSTTYKKYWNEFVLDWLFYVLVILILLNVINGIIVDTFQELREENVRIYDLSLNSCLICSLKRSKFEIKGRDFDEHVSKEHNYSNYFHYIFKIRRSDRYNLNAIDSHVLKCLEARKVDFLPIKTAKNLPMND